MKQNQNKESTNSTMKYTYSQKANCNSAW